MHLWAAVHLWADLSRSACAWARDYHQRHRDRGQSHARALRCLGQRWLKIPWATMWQHRTTCDGARHLADRQRYGGGAALLPAGGGAK